MKLPVKMLQKLHESHKEMIDYLRHKEMQPILPLRVKFFHSYATELIGTEIYDRSNSLIGMVENFLFGPVDKNGKIVGIKVKNSDTNIINPKSLYWWLDLEKNKKFAVLTDNTEPEYKENISLAISLGSQILYGSEKLNLTEATLYGSIFGYPDRIDAYPETNLFPSEYQFIDEIYLGHDRRSERIVLERWDMPDEIDWKNKVLLTPPEKIRFRTWEEIDKTLKNANMPGEGGREWSL